MYKLHIPTNTEKERTLLMVMSGQATYMYLFILYHVPLPNEACMIFPYEINLF